MPTCPADLDCFASKFDADPDIAGIGVIVAFLVSAWTCLFVITIEYFSMRSDEIRVHFTPLDDLLTRAIKQLTRRLRKPWALQSIQPAVLLVSDQQLITGIAIMSVGYIQHCTIPQYHFYIVYWLGFVSCQVYNASLIALRAYVDKRPEMKLWRAVMMTVLFTMVFLNTFVVDHDDFLTGDDEYTYYGASTQCVWDNLTGASHYTYFSADLVLTLALLVWAYLDSIWYLYPDVFRCLTWLVNILQLISSGLSRLYDWINTRTLEPKQIFAELRQVDTRTQSRVMSIAVVCRILQSGLLSVVIRSSFWILFIPTLTILELLRSQIINLWRIYSVVLSATLSLVDTRNGARDEEAINGDENEWGFGQLLPVLLLMLPIMSILETYQEARGNGDHNEGEGKSQGFILQPLGSNIVHSEPATLPSHSSFQPEEEDTTLPGNGSYRQQRQDTEARIGLLDSAVADNESATTATEEKLSLRRRTYESRLFKAWITFCAVAVFGASTYGATLGFTV
ncbi:hypothetical protein F4677DRAFT_403556 [Hypoxylon crocopeplum]|nr:hypothetical protein F4677DRAFT_403556 [Hypoxylon crocopeplum]